MFVVFLAFLFFVLSPGILVVLPIKGYKLVVVAAAHAVIFATIYHFVHGWNTSERFANQIKPDCPEGKTFYGGMGKCANTVGPSPANSSEPICSIGKFDPATSMCVAPDPPVAKAPAEACPPGCAPIDTNECEDTCSLD